MKNLIAAITLILASSPAFAWNSDVEIKVGADNYTAIPACGVDARVKAVYSKVAGNEGRLVLRMCDNTNCQYPILLNTNRNFAISGDGKTEGFYSQADGRKLNASCFEFQMHNPTGTQNLRARIGTDNFSSNTATITISN